MRDEINPAYRSVADHIDGIASSVGSLRVSRMFPRPGLQQIDPFLFLDFFDLSMPANAPGGDNAHPHRGFEAVSIFLKGEVGYRDSLGNRGVLRAGSVEWMTAGSGIVHDTHSDHEFAKRGGRIQGLQLWVNLPARLKMMDPSARYIPPEAVPEADIAGGRARLIAGEAQAATFTSSSTGARVLLAAGEPLNEPVASWGPFVMNTPDEILKAQVDYRAGLMGSLPNESRRRT